MKDKEKINHLPLINKAIKIAFNIQNKGLATVFINFSGHVNQISFRIYEPVYYDRAEYVSIECYIGWNDSEKSLLNVISKLSAINRKKAINEERQKEIASKLILANKRAELDRLKKELGESV